MSIVIEAICQEVSEQYESYVTKLHVPTTTFSVLNTRGSTLLIIAQNTPTTLAIADHTRQMAPITIAPLDDPNKNPVDTIGKLLKHAKMRLNLKRWSNPFNPPNE